MRSSTSTKVMSEGLSHTPRPCSKSDRCAHLSDLLQGLGVLYWFVCQHTIKQWENFNECGYMHGEVVKLLIARNKIR